MVDRVARRRAVAAAATNRKKFDDEDEEIDVEGDSDIGDVDLEEGDGDEDADESRPKGKITRRSSVPDEDEEEEEPAPVIRRRRVVEPVAIVETKQVARRGPKPVVEEYDEEPEEPVAPVRRERAVRLGSDEVAKQKASQDFWRNLMESIQAGEKVTATKLESGDYVITAGPEKTKPDKPKRKYSQKYLDWWEQWSVKTYDQKVAYAKKNKVKWAEHDNPQVNIIRLSQAVRESEGVVLWADQED